MGESRKSYDSITEEQIRFSMRQLWGEALFYQNIPLNSFNMLFVSSSEMYNQDSTYEYGADSQELRFNFVYFKSLAYLKLGFILLRFELYKMARDFAKKFFHRSTLLQGFSAMEANAIDDVAFAYALMMYTGHPVQHQQGSNKYLEDTLWKQVWEIFTEEFKIHVDIFKRVPKRNCNLRGEYFIKAYIPSNINRPDSTIKCKEPLSVALENNRLGTKEHPFRNIYDAADYLKRKEINLVKSDPDQKIFDDNIPHASFNFYSHLTVPEVDTHAPAFYPSPISGHSFVVNRLFGLHSKRDNLYSLKPNLYRQRLLFRGQHEDFWDNANHCYTCKPSLYRVPKACYIEDNIWTNELEVIIRTHPLVKMFDAGINLLGKEFVFEQAIYGLSQHYYNKTALLDLTSDIEAVKFFAVTKYKNGVYSPYIIDEDKARNDIGVIYYYRLDAGNSFQMKYLNGRKYELSTIGMQVFKRSGAQSGFLLHMDEELDLNDLPEVGKIYFRHDDRIAKDIFEKNGGAEHFLPKEDILDKIWKPRAIDRDIHRNLVVSKAALRLNHKLNNSARKSMRVLQEELRRFGIKVKNYQPAFHSDLLDEYYQDIKNGWWQDEFCKPIYFFGPDGPYFKDALLNLPQREEYKEYFYRRHNGRTQDYHA